jgi:hypothetical protein
MTAPFDVPRTQITAPVFEFKCLYTADLRRKQKRWQDGRLKYHTFNKRVMVYDEKSNFIGDVHWRADHELCDGEELQLERGGILVQVEEQLDTHAQDLTELVDKPRKEKEARAAARTANGSPGSFAGRAQNHGTLAHALMPRALNSLLTPSGHHGRAQIPIKSPFEERESVISSNWDIHDNERPSKRRKYNESVETKSGYAQNLTGTMLNLASSKPSSTPTIRYEAFKAKFSVPQKPAASIDLTSDDDQDAPPTKHIESIQQHDIIRNASARLHKSKHRESSQEKGGYASNLTGATLSLNKPPSTASTRPVRLLSAEKSITSRPGEYSNSSLDETDQRQVGSNSPTRETTFNRKKKAGTASTPDHQSSNFSPGRQVLPKKCLVSSSPSQAVAMPKKRTDSAKPPHVGKNDAKSASASFQVFSPKPSSPAPSNVAKAKHDIEITSSLDGQEPRQSWEVITDSNLTVHKVSKPAGSIAVITAKAKRLLVKDAAEVEQCFKEDNAPEVPPTQSSNRETNKSHSNAMVNQSLSSNIELARRLSDHSSAMPGSSIIGSRQNYDASNTSFGAASEPDKLVPTLRIKSRKPRKMMMFMEQPSGRVAHSPETSLKDTANIKEGGRVAVREPVLSQATIELDSLIHRQEKRIQARLNKSQPRLSINLDDSSPSPTDHEITHHPIDQRLSVNMPEKPSVETISAHSFLERPVKSPAVSSLATSSIQTSCTKIPSAKVSLLSTASPTGSSSAAFFLPDGTLVGNTNVQSQKASSQTGKEPVVSLSGASSPFDEPTLQVENLETSRPTLDLPPARETLVTAAKLIETCLPTFHGSNMITVDSIQKDDTIPALDISHSSNDSVLVGAQSLCNMEQAFTNDQIPKGSICTTTLQESTTQQNQKSHNVTRETSPDDIVDALRPTVENFRTIVKSSPRSTSPHAQESQEIKATCHEQSAPMLSKLSENRYQDSAEKLLEVDKSTAATIASTVTLQPLGGSAVRTVNSFGSRWQGSDISNSSDFVLSIATTNQPKFKLSKPVPRARPLGLPHPNPISRPDAHIDGTTNSTQDDGNGMLVTATGPWSREAFDLFGSWRPVNG